MKKFFVLTASALLLIACGKGNSGTDTPVQPADSISGDWYCVHQKTDVSILFDISGAPLPIQLGSIDTTFQKDTVFAEPVCYTITSDDYFVVNNDTVSTCRYEEQTHTLYVAVAPILDVMGLGRIEEMLLQQALPTEIPAIITVEGNNAIATVNLEKKDSIATLATYYPYAYKINTILDLSRTK